MKNHTLTPNRLAVLEANCKRAAQVRRERVAEKLATQMAEYALAPASCASCQSLLPFETRKNKYCSRSCGAAFTNKMKGERSQATKDKISKAFADKPKHEAPLTSSTCMVCNTTFQTKRNGGYVRQVCSDACLTEHRSRIGRKSAATRVVRSKDEIKLFELCQQRYPDSQHNVVLSDGWDADISIPSLKVAILWHGIWHREQMSFNNHSLSQVQTRDRRKTEALIKAGWTVIVYHDNEFTPQTAFDDLVGRTGFEPVTLEL